MNQRKITLALAIITTICVSNNAYAEHGGHGGHGHGGGGYYYGGWGEPYYYPWYPMSEEYYVPLYVAPVYREATHHSVSKTTVAAQQQLKNLGYYDGDVDGHAGPKTKAAVSAFQANKGLPVTGSLNAATLQSLGVSSVPND